MKLSSRRVEEGYSPATVQHAAKKVLIAQRFHMSQIKRF